MLTQHPTPWAALPCDDADMFKGIDMWFFNDANGEEVFYGRAMSLEVRDYILKCVNGASVRKDIALPRTVIDAVDQFGDLCAENPQTGVKLAERSRLLGVIAQHMQSTAAPNDTVLED